MISARKFCQEPGYPIAIFLTYSFDPLFFERVPLDDLSVGGTRRILILADASEIMEAMKRCIGQVFHLGRKYTLAEAKASNLFHPKMIIRLSPEGGRLWMGSGNLTYTGWGGNHELATAWSIGPGTDDAGGWLVEILRSVATLTSSEAFLAQIETVRSSIPWLGESADNAAQGPVLLGMPNHSLASQLARRWEGRRFTSLKIYTGSTDVDGAFLLWAHKTFGVTKATVCLTPSFASFEVKRLAKIPIEVQFVERDPKRRVHAKFYWFSGPNGHAAIMGSANCSAAAWLANHDNGNVELITIYDTAEPADFAPILSDFNEDLLLPEDFLVAPVELMEQPGNESAGPCYRITSIRLRALGRTIEALVEPEPGHEATLIIGTKQHTLRVPMKLSGARLVGRLSEEISLGVEPIFATMEILSGSGLVVTPPRWIDNERAIENAARDRHVDPNYEVFAGRGFGGANEQRIIQAIYAVSSSLLNFETPDLSSFPTAHRGQNKSETADEPSDEQLRPVDPSTLTYRLNEQGRKTGAFTPDQAGAHGVSLQGIMRMLFATEDEPEIDLSQERWSADEPEKYTLEDEPGGYRGNPPQESAPKRDAEALASLLKQIDLFLSELAKPSFADGCPASTLAQALVFPILLGIKGSEEGWLPDDVLASIACRVVQVMFLKRYGRDKPRGLFRQVQTRYVAAGMRVEFLKAIGDGALYTVLLGALTKPEAHSIASLVQQADAILHVMSCPELLALSNPDQRTALAKNVIIPDANFAIGERAEGLAVAMKKLTTCLEAWDRDNPGQAHRNTLHRAGSVLWSEHGWEVTPRKPAETYRGGIKLDTVAEHDTDIGLAIDELWHAMQEGRATFAAMPMKAET